MHGEHLDLHLIARKNCLGLEEPRRKLCHRSRRRGCISAERLDLALCAGVVARLVLGNEDWACRGAGKEKLRVRTSSGETELCGNAHVRRLWQIAVRVRPRREMSSCWMNDTTSCWNCREAVCSLKM